MIEVIENTKKSVALQLDKEEILRDYRIAYQSRQASLIGRKEVMGGKAKFGIFGDGKEIPQLALARAFKEGDFRSGYYRDQTLMMALGDYPLDEFFAQLYANPDVEKEPASAGRAMNAHFGTRLINDDGSWKDQTSTKNTSSDVSPTASQMPRLVGLAYASRLYRELEELQSFSQFSKGGSEVAFGTIGNASSAEGMFWEAINAIGVLQAPVVMSIWDDEYGISVPNEFQHTRESLAEMLSGFSRKEGESRGYDIYVVKAWDYPALLETYAKATEVARRDHVPAIIHVVEVTQPQGHSTSGSHERYKSKERLDWEKEFDGLRKMREWMLDSDIIKEAELVALEKEDRLSVEKIRDESWEDLLRPIRAKIAEMSLILTPLLGKLSDADAVSSLMQKLQKKAIPARKDIMTTLHNILLETRDNTSDERTKLVEWKRNFDKETGDNYSSHLYCEGDASALNIPQVAPVFSENSRSINGFDILNGCFDAAMKRDPRIIAFGEDVGYLGDVNQGFKGLQEKFGELRVSDTGIRECTIMGQAIGMALRGLRPIAEIQYLDYVLYGLQILSDDLACLHWRTKGGQKAPVIVRTRGHRLEGIWHAGSPMASMIHLLRGMHVLVPRNMTQAAGFYNTLLQADDPAIVVEVLNGYRLKETLPDNVGEFTIPLGVPETLRSGNDVTVVTYGACCAIAMEAADQLAKVNIDLEVIDVQSLLPFDLHGKISESLKKTNRIVFLDEDIPGGTTAYMLQEVMEKQRGYYHLDSQPRTLTAKAHRPAFGSDGDYWSKPNSEHVFEVVYEIMHESDPQMYPLFLR
ncbi:MAG: alpha-ketoacid dehydrogenase subunit alpha/beta [Calditrichia bacterium]